MQQVRKMSLVLASVFLLVSGVFAKEAPKQLFINITSQEARPAGMGLAIGNAMQGAGIQTIVLLGADAAPMALSKGNAGTYSPTGASPKAMIASLIKKGGKVFVCGISAKDREYSKSDLIKGVEIATPADMVGGLYAPGTQSLSF